MGKIVEIKKKSASGKTVELHSPGAGTIMELPKVADHRGNLTFIENSEHIPFDIKRVYYLYDVPGGSVRGGHAHKQTHEFIVAANGSFDVILDDGTTRLRHHLNRSYYGLYAPPMVWRELDNFSSGSVCLVLASEVYDEDDYIRDYDEFVKSLHRNPRRVKADGRLEI